MATEPDTKPFSISREFNAPRDVVWKAWTSVESMLKWWGPKGCEVLNAKMDLKPGGTFHYLMRYNGQDMWGRFVYREITPKERIVWVNSFSDAAGGVTRHPFSAKWPLEMLTTLTLTERAGKTTVSIVWTPLNATDEERKTFDEGRESMNKGWTGTLDGLTEYLAKGSAENASDLFIGTTRVINAPRERVFNAWTDPNQLKQWWGPNGFTNTFHVFDQRPGGEWIFDMHGPDGKSYPNKSVFVEITKPERIVFDHVSPPAFQITATFEDLGGKTKVTFRMGFKTAAECAVIKRIAVDANEQNFDRLEALLARLA